MGMKRMTTGGLAGHYHCMSRICGGERLLGDAEKAMLTEMLWRVADFSGVEVLTFCVMSNHLHVLVFVLGEDEPPPSDEELVRRYGVLYGVSRAPYQPAPEVLAAILAQGGFEADRWRQRLLERMGDVSHFMKTLKQRFSTWYNKTHGRYGTLWSGRFCSVLVESSARTLATVAAYIDLNPVRAGLVEDPALYRWSAYGEAMGGEARSRLALARIFDGEQASVEVWKQTAANYRLVLFGKGSAGPAGTPRIDAKRAQSVMERGGQVKQIEALRCRVRYFTAGAVLGSHTFVTQWFERTRSSLSPKRPSGPRAMKGANWEGLTVYRNLRTDVFGRAATTGSEAGSQ